MEGYQRTARIVIVNLAVLGVGIAIAELVFGAWLNPGGLNRLNLVKGRTVVYHVDELYEAESSAPVRYTRDKYGLRGAYGDDPSRIDLLTVGGSTTDQRYIPDGLTWQDVLQEQFLSVGRPIVVVNAGVDGQSTIGHIRNFDWWFPYVPNLRPRYVLFGVGLNDFYLGGEDSDWDVLVQDTFIEAIKEKSALWHLVRTMRGVVKATRVRAGHRRVDFVTLQWTSQPLQNSYEFMSSPLDAFAHRLRLLASRTRSLGAKPIFVTQPSRQYKLATDGVRGQTEVSTYAGRQINGVDYYHLRRAFDTVTATLCREEHLVCVDLAAEPGWEDADFYDFEHLTPRGANKFGLHLFEKLRTLEDIAGLGAASVKE